MVIKVDRRRNRIRADIAHFAMAPQVAIRPIVKRRIQVLCYILRPVVCFGISSNANGQR
jgi:hypothetical protein